MIKPETIAFILVLLCALISGAIFAAILSGCSGEVYRIKSPVPCNHIPDNMAGARIMEIEYPDGTIGHWIRGN